MNNPEGVGANFNPSAYMEARKVARRVALLFASHVEPGISEEEGLELLEELFKRNGVEKKWHPSKFRIGKNTLKSFREVSEPGIRLQKEDIYFLDIGPVLNGQEADFGQTFTVGQNAEHSKIQRASKQVWEELAVHWKVDKLSGQELYQKGVEVAAKLGYELNEKMGGHRLGDFPHALHYKGQLADFEGTPVEKLWVLEVHLRHPSKPIGAFYEDILL